MKKIMHKISLLSFLLLISSFSAEARKSTVEKSKTVNKTFKVSSGQAIHIDNKFGEVNVQNWDKKEVVLEVNIIVKNNNEKKAMETLDNIRIATSETNEKISISTVIDNAGKATSGKNSEDIEINYQLKIPATNPLDLNNSFGATIIDDRSGSTKLKLEFGTASIGKLQASNNDLHFHFCDPVIIQHINKGAITLKHSKMELNSSEDVTLESEMSSSKSERLKSASITLKFGSMEVNEVENLDLRSQMSSAEINELHRSGTITTKYGAFTVNKVSSQISKLIIDSEFSPVKLFLEKKGSYNLTAKSKMGNLNLPSKRTPTHPDKEESEKKIAIKTGKEFEGRIGEEKASQNTIKISSSFGEVKIGLTD